MIKQTYHVAAPVPQEVRDKAAKVIQRVRYQAPASQHLNLLLEVIDELTEAGLNFFFISPLHRVGAGSMTLKVAQMGLHSTQKGMSLVIKKVLQRLDERQLVAIIDFLQEILFEPEHAEAAA